MSPRPLARADENNADKPRREGRVHGFAALVLASLALGLSNAAAGEILALAEPEAVAPASVPAAAPAASTRVTRVVLPMAASAPASTDAAASATASPATTTPAADNPAKTPARTMISVPVATTPAAPAPAPTPTPASTSAPTTPTPVATPPVPAVTAAAWTTAPVAATPPVTEARAAVIPVQTPTPPAPAPAQEAAIAPPPRRGSGGSGEGGERRPRRREREQQKEEAAPEPEPEDEARSSGENEWTQLVSALTSRAEEKKVVFYYECKNIPAADLKVIINEFISDTGRVAPAKESEVLIVEDSEAKLAVIREICERVDQRVPQVLVKAQIVEFKITNDFEKEVNMLMSGAGAGSFLQNIFGGLQASGATPRLGTDGKPAGNNYGGEITIRPYSRRRSDGTYQTLDAAFRMLETRGRAKILSCPNLVLRRGITGNIFTGEHFPVVSQNNSGGTVTTSTDFRKIGIGLTVVPRMIKDGTVRLYVKPEISSLSGYEEANGARNPVIAMRSAETELEMKDGELLAIGGLLSEDEITEVRKVPGFGSIPGIGGLFRGSDRSVVKKQLAIFLTIHIMPESGAHNVTVFPADEIPQPAADEIQRLENTNRPGHGQPGAAIQRDWFKLVQEGYE